MKKLLIFLIGITLIAVMAGCMKSIEPSTFESADHKILYDLMVERCKAVSAGDMERIYEIYAKDSPELDWLAGQINYLSGFMFNVIDVKRISIVGIDAAGQFSVSVDPSNRPLREVDVLYIREGSQWKIVSVAQR